MGSVAPDSAQGSRPARGLRRSARSPAPLLRRAAALGVVDEPVVEQRIESRTQVLVPSSAAIERVGQGAFAESGTLGAGRLNQAVRSAPPGSGFPAHLGEALVVPQAYRRLGDTGSVVN